MLRWILIESAPSWGMGFIPCFFIISLMVSLLVGPATDLSVLISCRVVCTSDLLGSAFFRWYIMELVPGFFPSFLLSGRDIYHCHSCWVCLIKRKLVLSLLIFNIKIPEQLVRMQILMWCMQFFSHGMCGTPQNSLCGITHGIVEVQGNGTSSTECNYGVLFPYPWVFCPASMGLPIPVGSPFNDMYKNVANYFQFVT